MRISLNNEQNQDPNSIIFMSLPITTIYTVILGGLTIALAIRIALMRRKFKIPLGDEGNRRLQKAIAAHENAVDNIPLALILMLVAELNGGNAELLYIIGSLLVIARLLHAWGMSHRRGHSFGRFYGIALTWVSMLGLIVTNIVYAV